MKSVDHYKTLLDTRLAELEGRLQRIEADLDVEADADVEERAVEREGDEVLEGLGEAGKREILMIRAALDRVSAGTYGECANCGEQIAPARLELVPHAAVCANCASDA